jgi:hypothetical protein
MRAGAEEAQESCSVPVYVVVNKVTLSCRLMRHYSSECARGQPASFFCIKM